MVELKTLKEIEDRIYGKYRSNLKFIDTNLIRIEAIKWVKRYQKEKSRMSQEEMVYWCYMGRIHALTEFHNITEEDLK